MMIIYKSREVKVLWFYSLLSFSPLNHLPAISHSPLRIESLITVGMFDSVHNLISAVLAVVVILSSISAYRHRRRNPHALPYPPGPSPHFLVGNFFDIPKKRPYIEYAKWSKRYNSTPLPS